MLNRAQATLELIRLRGSDMYKDNVPALTESTPISVVGNVILTQPLVYKEFTMLFGALIETEVIKRKWENPLRDLIGVGSPLGEFRAEVGMNPATPHEYDPNHPERVLEYAMSDDKVAYYSRNIKEFFKVSFAYEDMQGAFESYGAFDDYYQDKIATLESGKEMSAYNHVMEAICVNYMSGVFKKSTLTLSNNYGAWVEDVKNVVDYMKFPSDNFNNYENLQGANGKWLAWSRPEDLYIMATSSWINGVDVNFLTGLFNLDKAEIAQRIIKVPSFSYDTYDADGNYLDTVDTDIEAIVIDRRAFKCRDDLALDLSKFNEQTLVTNFFKHYWATYAISPLANVYVYTKANTSTLKMTTNGNYNVRYQHPTTANFESDSNITIKSSTPYEVNGISGEKMTSAEVTDIVGVLEFDEETGALTSEITTDVAAALIVVELLSKSTLATVTVGETPYSLSAFIQEDIATAAKDVDVSIERKATTNLLRARDVEIPSGDDTISYTLTEEIVDAVKEKYGNNIYIKMTVGATNSTVTTPTADTTFEFSIGVKNI